MSGIFNYLANRQTNAR